LLLFEALGWEAPAFCHAPLVCDAAGRRLAKRSGGLAIRDLRAAGWSPADVLHQPIDTLAEASHG
jgi:glutamyl-tRNA synthetase